MNPSDPLHQKAIGTIGKLQHLDDPKDGPCLENVRCLGRTLNFALDGRADQKPIGTQQNRIDEFLRSRRVHQQRRQEEWEQNGVLKRQDRQFVGQLRRRIPLLLAPARSHLNLHATGQQRAHGILGLLLGFSGLFFAFLGLVGHSVSTFTWRAPPLFFGRVTDRKPSSRRAVTPVLSKGIEIFTRRSKAPKAISTWCRRPPAAPAAGFRTPLTLSKSPSTLT